MQDSNEEPNMDKKYMQISHKGHLCYINAWFSSLTLGLLQ